MRADSPIPARAELASYLKKKERVHKKAESRKRRPQVFSPPSMKSRERTAPMADPKQAEMWMKQPMEPFREDQIHGGKMDKP